VKLIFNELAFVQNTPGAFQAIQIAVAGLQAGAFTVKVLFFVWLIGLIRWTFPRFRYDQVMKMGWKMVMPLALLNILGTGVYILLEQSLKPTLQKMLGY
jgi:NADH:ubiquinone oxidoreductase subunit H